MMRREFVGRAGCAAALAAVAGLGAGQDKNASNLVARIIQTRV